MIYYEQIHTRFLNLADNVVKILQCTNTTSTIFKSGTFLPFLSFSILFTYILIEGLSVFSPCVFKDIFKIISNI